MSRRDGEHDGSENETAYVGGFPGQDVARAIYRRVDDIKWRSLFSFDNILDNVFKLIGAAVVLVTAHYAGVTLLAMFSRWANEKEATRLTEDEVNEKSLNTVSEQERRGIVLQMLGNLSYVAALAVGFVVMLSIFGVEIATILTVLALVGVVLSFALQGTFTDIASGLLLALFQTYDIGDIVVIGAPRQQENIEGRVIGFGLVNTLLEDLATRTLITVPNTTVQKAIVTNYSRHRHHMFSFDVRISNLNSDFARVLAGLQEDMKDARKYPDIIRHPAVDVSVGVRAMDAEGTVLGIRVPFLVSADLNSKRTRVRTAVRKALDEMGVVLIDNDYSPFSDPKYMFGRSD